MNTQTDIHKQEFFKALTPEQQQQVLAILEPKSMESLGFVKQFSMTPITKTDLMVHSSGDYNRAIWSRDVNRYADQYNAKFWIVPAGNGYDYERFYVAYYADGIKFFCQFTPFCAGLSSNGFTQVQIEDNTVYTRDFAKGEKRGRLENCKQNRVWMRKQTALCDMMFSSRI